MIQLFSTEISASAGTTSRREDEAIAVKCLVEEAFGKGAVIDHTPEGAPYIQDRPGTYISISHCQDTCVMAVSDKPVGVDIETARPQLERIAHKFLTPCEMQSLNDKMQSLDGEMHILDGEMHIHSLMTLMQLWTAKEAVFKCAGNPSLVISEIEILLDSINTLSFHEAKAIARRRTFDVCFPLITHSHVIAAASPGKCNHSSIMEIHYFTLT